MPNSNPSPKNRFQTKNDSKSVKAGFYFRLPEPYHTILKSKDNPTEFIKQCIIEKLKNDTV